MSGNKLNIERLLSLCRTYNESCNGGNTADGFYIRKRLAVVIQRQLTVVQANYTSVKLEKNDNRKYNQLVINGTTYKI